MPDENSTSGKCLIAGCSKIVHARELCIRHYHESDYFAPCIVDGCPRKGCVGRGFCGAHYHRWRRHGDPLAGRKSNTKRAIGEPGRRAMNEYGYIRIHFPEHPNVQKSDGYVAEHIMVMADHLGRALRHGETVHHKNGMRDDNRIENLELWVKSQPAGQRASDLVIWAEEILHLYGRGVEDNLI